MQYHRERHTPDDIVEDLKDLRGRMGALSLQYHVLRVGDIVEF